MIILFTETARKDFENIFRYIASQSGELELATDYLKALRYRIDILRFFPELGHPADNPKLHLDNFRCLNLDDYRIYYRPNSNKVIITLIKHGHLDF